MSDLLKHTGKFTLTKHAMERIRQRVGITALDAQIAWVNELITKSNETVTQGKQTKYVGESFEAVCDGLKVITINPVANSETYAKQIGGAVKREVGRLLVPKERLLRKAEIKVAELTLNFLKARNPKTKDTINGRLLEATDEKQRIADEVYAIKQAAKRYGAEV